MFAEINSIVIFVMFFWSLLGIQGISQGSRRWIVLTGAVLMILEAYKTFVQITNPRFCTSKQIIVIRILLNALMIIFASFGQFFSGRTVSMIEDHIAYVEAGASGSRQALSKFSGMDLTFLINQVF